MSSHHIQKHVPRPLALWFENGFLHFKYSIELTFRKHKNMKMAILHITAHFMVGGYNYALSRECRVPICQAQSFCTSPEFGPYLLLYLTAERAARVLSGLSVLYSVILIWFGALCLFVCCCCCCYFSVLSAMKPCFKTNCPLALAFHAHFTGRQYNRQDSLTYIWV